MLRKKNYKDMEKYYKTRRQQRKRYYAKTAFLYPRRPWTPEEEELVANHEICDSDLSVKIQRSVSAIQKRRNILKHLAECEKEIAQ